MLSLCQPAPRRRLALTPLIDVVFLLLMFFMLTSSFDKFATIDLSIGGKAAVGSSTAKISNIIVRVHENGRLDINGLSVGAKGFAAAVLTQIKTQSLDLDKVRILLQPRKKSQSQAIVDVVHALQQIKITNIVIVR